MSPVFKWSPSSSFFPQLPSPQSASSPSTLLPDNPNGRDRQNTLSWLPLSSLPPCCPSSFSTSQKPFFCPLPGTSHPPPPPPVQRKITWRCWLEHLEVLRNPKHWAWQRLLGRTENLLLGQAVGKQDGRSLIRSSRLRRASASFCCSQAEGKTPGLVLSISVGSPLPHHPFGEIHSPPMTTGHLFPFQTWRSSGNDSPPPPPNESSHLLTTCFSLAPAPSTHFHPIQLSYLLQSCLSESCTN